MVVDSDAIASRAQLLRALVVIMSERSGSGHPTSCLSAADIVATLFFHVLVLDIDDIEHPLNDRFIMSKGHASALLYAVWHILGKISYDELLTYRQFGSSLEGHPTMRFAYTEAATGSLGTGLSIGVGQALYAKKEKLDFKVYVLVGDGELFEGSNWEAAAMATVYALNNLILIVDCNRLGQSCPTAFGHDIVHYKSTLEAFGFETLMVDGHDINQLVNAFGRIDGKGKKPYALLAKTYKGKGVAFAEDTEGFHGKVFTGIQYTNALHALEDRSKMLSSSESSSLMLPKKPNKRVRTVFKKKRAYAPELFFPSYHPGEMRSNRYGFGDGLRNVGRQYEGIVVCDADVQNSTYTELFAKEFPDHFIQCFIGEQNMIGVAIGLAKRGYSPFVATFGAFLSRAHDQIRMAAIGTSPLRICGSHAGISVGQDGPSQMALEDIAYMRCLPESVVLSPSDATSSFKLVHEMYCYQQGISYMRTTRPELPVLYEAHISFRIGGCHVLKKQGADSACVIATGVTVFEALKAYDRLQSEYGTTIAIIDLYSIKPFDYEMVMEVIAKSRGKAVVVEDHYVEGGVGEIIKSAYAHKGFIITSLAVPALPRSGLPYELLAWAHIDAHAIVEEVLALTTQ